MKRILTLLPTALICVNEEEKDAYLTVVPKERLICHHLTGLAYIREWLNRHIQEDCLVMIDDDLRAIWWVVGEPRRYTDPRAIMEVIENTHQVACDLSFNVFTWSRSVKGLNPEYDPIKFCAPIGGSFGLRGAARNRAFDVTLPGRADADFTLQTVLEDRILLGDVRVYFDFGRCFSGAGGNSGLITDEQFALTTKILKERWGPYIEFKPRSDKRKRNSEAYRIVVTRRNPVITQH